MEPLDRHIVQVLAQDPYDKGGLLKVKLDDPAAVATLLDYNGYQAKLDESPHN